VGLGDSSPVEGNGGTLRRRLAAGGGGLEGGADGGVGGGLAAGACLPICTSWPPSRCQSQH